MTSSPKDPIPPPDGRAPDAGSRGPSFRLLASQRQESSRALPFAIAAAGHAIVIALVLLFAPRSVKLLRDVFDSSPILLIDDTPTPIAYPESQITPPPQMAGGTDDERARTAPAPRVNSPADAEAPVTPLAAPTEIPRTIGPGAQTGVTEGGRSAAERFSGASNPLLYAPPGAHAPNAPATVGVEGATARLADRAREYNDSIAAEEAAAAKATDWTYTDKDGKRWGISPGRIHLGDVTIPLQRGTGDLFTTAPGRRDEVNALVRSWTEIEAQASRAVVTDNIKERVKQIRERKDKEREARKKPVANGS